MADDLGERLLASYADLGEAMVIQNVLETEGIPCRIADLAQLPSHVFGMGGTLGRSVGLWVLEVDAERAVSLLAALGAPETAVNEEALTAEALAAGPASTRERVAPADTPARGRSLTAGPGVSSRLTRVASAVLALLAAIAIARGCR